MCVYMCIYVCVLMCMHVCIHTYLFFEILYFAETLLTPEELNDFLKSSVMEKVNAILEKPEIPTDPEEFYFIRDALLLRILQTNAQRPAAVAGITQKRLDRAKTEEGWATVAVSILE